MLKIRVGTMEPYDGSINDIFEDNYEDEWFDDTFVKDLVMEIDSSEVVSANLIISPILGPINYERLSGGVKVLIMLYKMPEMEQWASSCGDNCFPAMARIGNIQDVQVKFSHCPRHIPDEMEALFIDNGEIARGDKEIGLGISKRLSMARIKEEVNDSY